MAEKVQKVAILVGLGLLLSFLIVANNIPRRVFVMAGIGTFPGGQSTGICFDFSFQCIPSSQYTAIYLQVATANLILRVQKMKSTNQDIQNRRANTFESWINDGLLWPDHVKVLRMLKNCENVPKQDSRSGQKSTMSHRSAMGKSMR